MTTKEIVRKRIREQKRWLWCAAIWLALPIILLSLIGEWWFTLIIGIGCVAMYIQQYKYTKESIKFWEEIEKLDI